jgi:hypothetical protein
MLVNGLYPSVCLGPSCFAPVYDHPTPRPSWAGANHAGARYERALALDILRWRHVSGLFFYRTALFHGAVLRDCRLNKITGAVLTAAYRISQSNGAHTSHLAI